MFIFIFKLNHWRIILSVGPVSGSANDLSNEIMISSC